jgi:hypothetical protein
MSPGSPGLIVFLGLDFVQRKSPLLAQRTREKWGTREVKIPTLSQRARQRWAPASSRISLILTLEAVVAFAIPGHCFNHFQEGSAGMR